MTFYLSNLLMGFLIVFSMISQAAENTDGVSGLTGQYIGYYTLTMNTSDPDALAALTLPTTTLDDVEYIVLGQSIGKPLWVWDFDNKTVTWGGDTLYAMYMVTPDYQPFVISAIPERTDDTVLEISSQEEITIPMTDNGDGTYTLDYAMKIYLSMAGYPIGSTSSKYLVSITDDNNLKIEAMDYEIDGDELDGVTGTRIAGVFPYVVQPQYDSDVMYLDDGSDTNTDGITDLQADLLGLNSSATDSDGDGKSDADEVGYVVRPTDSDADGSPDIVESLDEENDATILGGLVLPDGSGFDFITDDDISISAATLQEYTVDIDTDITQETSDGDIFTYQKLEFSLDQTTVLMGDFDSLDFSLNFSESIPDDIMIYEQVTTIVYDSETDTATKTVAITEADYTVSESDDSVLQLSIAYTFGDSVRKTFLIGTVVAEDETDEDSGGHSSSGGSITLWSILFMLGFLRLFNKKQIFINRQ